MRLLLVALAALLLGARPYEDTKQRFRLELAPKWELSPQFGDTAGMVFKKQLPKRRGTGMALLMVRVAPDGTSATDFADAIEEALAAQPGYRPLGESPINIGGTRGFVRRYETTIDAERRLNKRIHAHYLSGSGRAYLIHVETGTLDMPKIRKDVELMLAGFRPMRPQAARPPPSAPPIATDRALLHGKWVNEDGLVLILGKTGRFNLADVEGAYEVSGAALTLIIPKKGRESFTFRVEGDQLTLRSPNLPHPVTYQRHRGGPTRTAGDFVGSWVTVGTEQKVELELGKDGRFRMGEFEGDWRYANGFLRLEQSRSEVITYEVLLKAGRLILSGSDLDRPIAFERRRSG